MRRGLGLEPGEWWGQGGAAGAAAGAGGASGLPAQSHLDCTPRAEDRGWDLSFCHGVRGSVPSMTQHCFCSASAALVLGWLLFAPTLWGPVVRQPQLPVVEVGGPPTGPAAPDVPAQGDGGKWSIRFGTAWGDLWVHRGDAPAAMVALEPEGVGRREGVGAEGNVFEERAPAHPSGWLDEAPGLCGARIGRALLGWTETPSSTGKLKSRA